MSAGKGDKPRKVDGEKYRASHERIFGKRPMAWESNGKREIQLKKKP